MYKSTTPVKKLPVENDVIAQKKQKILVIRG